MPQLPWFECVTVLNKHVAKISTPRGHGTGFLFLYSGSLCALATADHVVREAANWREPVRMDLEGSKSLFLAPNQRAIIRRQIHDTAAILFEKKPDSSPMPPLTLVPEKHAVKIGVDIGWLGYPGIAPSNLCFFLGRVSSHLGKEHSYLVDGVAINGVSGGLHLYRNTMGSFDCWASSQRTCQTCKRGRRCRDSA